MFFQIARETIFLNYSFKIQFFTGVSKLMHATKYCYLISLFAHELLISLRKEFKRCDIYWFIGCNLTEVQGIGIGLRVAGKPEYNSIHGIIVGEDVSNAYKYFEMAVQSRPWIEEAQP